jgi:anthranilate phosphoribosyltransferase
MAIHRDAVSSAKAAEAEQHSLRGYLTRLAAGNGLARQEARQLLDLLLSASSSEAQIAAILTALSVKGETEEELAGLADGMRAHMLRLPEELGRVIDIVGTGASRAKTFNVSTASAFVIAAAGLPVAKHGGRAATSRSGSADLLGALGIAFDIPPELAVQSLRQLGLCFLFAPKYHPATARVAGIRKQLGIRTAFNLIGPLSNPALAPLQILGVSDGALQRKMAAALVRLGCEKAWVVHGLDGLDEISLETETRIFEVANGAVREFTLSPEDFGLRRGNCDSVRGGDATQNAVIATAVLDGSRRDVARDLVLLNASAALHLGLGLELKAAVALAEKAIDNGSAIDKLQRVRALTNSGVA